MGNTGSLAALAGSNSAANSAANSAGLSIGIGSAISAGLSATGELMNLGSYWAESRALRAYGNTLYNEALLEADRVMEQGRQFKADQKMSYVMSGVQVQGTPMQILEDTSLKIGDEVNAIKRRGEAQRALAYIKASQTRTKGITGFLSGITKSIGQIGTIYQDAKRGGVFDNNSSTSNTSTGIYLNKNAYVLDKDYV